MKKPDYKDYEEKEFYDVPQEIRKKYMNKTTVELLDILDSFSERNWIEEEKKHNSYLEDSIKSGKYDEYQLVLLEVLQRLELVKGYDVLRIIYSQIAGLEDKIDELDKRFKNHRHDKDKNYTEKPIW